MKNLIWAIAELYLYFLFIFQVIDEVDPALLAEYEAMAQQYEQPQQAAQPRADSYVPASGPAYASPSMLNPIYANARQDLGAGQLEKYSHGQYPPFDAAVSFGADEHTKL